MTTYRILGPGERIEAGDEFLYNETHGNPLAPCRVGWGPEWEGSIGHCTGRGALANQRHRRPVREDGDA